VAEGDFFDTNVVLYLLSADTAKADRAESLLASGGVISVQVLSDFASVARRKLGMPWAALREVITTLTSTLRIEEISLATHDLALAIAERYRLGVYDAQIVAAARLAGCATLYSEDMHDGLSVEGALTVVNPFRQARSRD
jgi:predicted nucleic acid-binding protein